MVSRAVPRTTGIGVSDGDGLGLRDTDAGGGVERVGQTSWAAHNQAYPAKVTPRAEKWVEITVWLLFRDRPLD